MEFLFFWRAARDRLPGLGANSLYADLVISAQFENSQRVATSATTYSGVEPDAAAANPAFASSNVWNALQAPTFQSASVSFSNLLNSTGADSGAGLSISHIDGRIQQWQRHAARYLSVFVRQPDFRL
ncbi:MAG: hypothetical protein ACRD4O_15140 [Bryobacteraceae bacterium]